MNQQKRVLSIGAHPDDADTSCAILLKKLADQGWEVRKPPAAAKSLAAGTT